MELVSVGLFGYQRFEDDFGDMDVTGSPVAIVGPNEAGKTSFLEALEHLNGAGAFSPRNPTRGYGGETCVRARFALDLDDLEAIASAGGLGQPKLLEIAKRSSSEAIRWTLIPALERDLEPRRKALAAAGKVRRGRWLKEREPEEDDPTLALLDETLAVLELDSPSLTDSQLEGVEALVAQLRQLSDAPPSVGRLADQLQALRDTEAAAHPNDAAAAVLLARRPRFLPFDVGWRQLESAFDFAEGADGPSPAMRALFELIEFDLESLRAAIAAGDQTTVAELVDIANADFETLFTGRWRQANVVVRIRVDSSFVYVFVRTAAGRLIPIAEKSAGLRQFIALLSFVEHRRQEGEAVVLLIDEAETHLHYDAQADLVNLFTHQGVVDKIIYTTHSAGCLPFDLGTGIRVIEPVGPPEVAKEDWERSRINNAFWVAGPGFSPLLLAMGAGSFAFSALRRAVVGEGITEVILLPTLLREALNRDVLEYQVVPGVSAVRPADVRELDTSAAQIAYVVDGDEGGRANHDKLLASEVVPVERIVTLGDGTGEELAVEDLIEPGLYLSAVNLVLERYEREPVPDGVIADAGRKAAVKAFVEARGEEKPSEREVAQQVLLLAAERGDDNEVTPVLYEHRREVVVDLHAALSGILGVAP